MPRTVYGGSAGGYLPFIAPGWLPTADRVLPILFADFTTEGGQNHYWYNGTQYAGSAAWLTAIGGTFARASSATYTNSSGLLVPNGAGSNALRFDYDPIILASNGILLEGASTNLIPQSNAFDNVSFWDTANNVTPTPSAATSPDGTVNAYSLIENGVNGQHNIGAFSHSVSITSGATVTLSVYVKQSTRSIVSLYFSDSGFTNSLEVWFDIANGIVLANSPLGTATFVGANIIPVANGFFRCNAAGTLGAGITAAFLSISPSTSTVSPNNYQGINGATAIYIYGSQMEQLSFASSYIPTSGAAVTRAVDNFNFPWTAASAAFLAVTKNQAVYSAYPRVVGTNGRGDPIAVSSNGTDFSSGGLHGPTISGSMLGLHKTMSTGNAANTSITSDGLSPTSSGNDFTTGVTTLYLGNDDIPTQEDGYGNILIFGAWNFLVSGSGLQRLTT